MIYMNKQQLEACVEQIQEIGKVIVNNMTDIQITKIQKYLEKKGYVTDFVNADDEILKLREEQYNG